MATSGTAVWNADVATLIEEAYELAGVEGRTGFQLRSAIRSLNLISLEWSNKGLNLWTVDQETTTIAAGVETATLPADTVDIIDLVVRIDDRDYRPVRAGVGTWAGINSKTQTAQRPNLFYVDRQIVPVLHIWPLPTSALTIVYWRMRRIQDAGGVDYNMDVPHRFLPALVAALAYQLALKRPDISQARLQVLKMEKEEKWNDAADEDRGRESFYIAPTSD